MDSLAFRALDRQVIEGKADDPALIVASKTYTYAQLLHDSASFAGGLRDLGVEEGTPVRLKVAERRIWVVSVLAIVRLGAEPAHEGDDAPFRIVGEPAVVRSPAGDFDVDVLIRAGRNDPAVAPDRDSEGYADRLTRRYGDVLAALIHGGTLT